MISVRDLDPPWDVESALIKEDGTWDANNPWIGSIVNSHTNLTEIVGAMDLLWRNDIDPAKVVMGLGFYGRSRWKCYLQNLEHLSYF